MYRLPVNKQRSEACYGVCRHETGDYDGALIDLDRALDLRLDNAWALAERGALK